MATQEINLVEVRIEGMNAGDRIYKKTDGKGFLVFVGTVTGKTFADNNTVVHLVGDGVQGQKKLSRAKTSGMRRFYKST